MRNKIIINIMIVYFLILSFVLIMQITSKETNAIEPLPSEITAEDKLKNSVVLAINSPVILVNEKQFLIDKDDSTITPIIENGKVYIPVTLLNTGFNANISFSPAKKETTVRLNNKAIIFYNDTKKISVIDNISEDTLEIESNSKIINDRFYIPLRTFAEIFDKEVFSYNDLIIISNMENIFDPIEEIETINGILERVNYLPIVGNEENLKKLIYSFEPKITVPKEEKTFLTKEITSISDNSNIQDNTQESLTEISSETLLENEQQKNTRYYIESIGNYNFYGNQGFLEIFINDKEKQTEDFLFRVELYNNELVDIILDENNLVLTYSSLNKDKANKSYTNIVTYDISDKNNIKKINEVLNNGNFFDNVLNGDYLYTITKLDASKGINLPLLEKRYYENNISKKYYKKETSLDKIYYFPDINDKEYTLVTINNIKDGFEEIKYNVFLGMGDNIIFNEDNLYITTSRNGKTNIYLFKLSLGDMNHLKRVSLNGEILNIKDSVIFNEGSITFKTDKMEKTYTRELEVID